MPNYTVGGRRYPNWVEVDAVEDVIRWPSRGSGGVTVEATTHKRLFHNWYFYDGLSDVVVWQNKGTTATAADEATPRMWHVRGGFGRHSISGSRGYSR